MNQVNDRDHYLNDFASKAAPLITSAGGRFIVRSGQATKLEGEPPKSRIVIIRFDNMDKLMAWYKSPKAAELQKIGDKYATVNSFEVEGVAK